MSRADLEAAAEEKYPASLPYNAAFERAMRDREAYIQGRLDQAEADARIAKMWPFSRELADGAATTGVVIAAAIREGVNDEQGTAGR